MKKNLCTRNLSCIASICLLVILCLHHYHQQQVKAEPMCVWDNWDILLSQAPSPSLFGYQFEEETSSEVFIQEEGTMEGQSEKQRKGNKVLIQEEEAELSDCFNSAVLPFFRYFIQIYKCYLGEIAIVLGQKAPSNLV